VVLLGGASVQAAASKNPACDLPAAKPRLFFEGVARFTGHWFGIPILILDSFEKIPQ